MLASCNDMYKVSSNDTENIHKLVATLESFEDEIPYLTGFGSVLAQETEETYVLKGNNVNIAYEYKRQEQVLYKEGVQLEENVVFKSLDDYVLYVVALMDSSSYCIGLNEFIPFIKETFLNAKDFKHSGKRAGKIFYSCEAKGNILTNNKEVLSLINKIDNDIQLKNDDNVKLSLLFSTDFSKIYPNFEMTINNKPLIIFS